MRSKTLTQMLTGMLINTMLLGAFAFGQKAAVNTGNDAKSLTFDSAKYLFEVLPAAESGDEYARVTRRITRSNTRDQGM